MKIVHKKKEFTRPELEGNLIADDEEAKFKAWKEANGKLEEEENKIINPNPKPEENSEFLDGSPESSQPVLTTSNNTDTNGVEVNPVNPEEVPLPLDNTSIPNSDIIPAETTETSEPSEEVIADTSTIDPETSSDVKQEENKDTIEALKDLVVSLTSKIDDMDAKISSLNIAPTSEENPSEEDVLPEIPEEKPVEEKKPEEATSSENTSTETNTGNNEENTSTETPDEDLDAEGEDVDKNITKSEMFKSFCKKNMQLSEKSDYIIGKLIRGKAYQLEEKIMNIVNSKIRSSIDEQKQQIRINNVKNK